MLTLFVVGNFHYNTVVGQLLPDERHALLHTLPPRISTKMKQFGEQSTKEIDLTEQAEAIAESQTLSKITGSVPNSSFIFKNI